MLKMQGNSLLSVYRNSGCNDSSALHIRKAEEKKKINLQTLYSTKGMSLTALTL